MKTISKTYTIHASVDEVFEALINPSIVEQWSGAGAIMTDQAGEKFSLWDGSIYGVNIEVTKDRIVQDWQEESWKTTSKVIMQLNATNEGTVVELVHENFPEGEYDDLSNGWDNYYFGPLKELVEGN